MDGYKERNTDVGHYRQHLNVRIWSKLDRKHVDNRGISVLYCIFIKVDSIVWVKELVYSLDSQCASL